MFRSEKRPLAKDMTNETTQKPALPQSWQQPVSAPPLEVVKPVTALPVQPPEQPKAIGERDAMARDIKDGVLNGFVGNGTVMNGEAAFKGMLRVDGNLTGQISSEDGTLIVGANGQVDANVNVSVAMVHGTVNGDITATKRIELGRSAKVVGNIQTPALIVEQGGILEGNCRMTQLSEVRTKDTSRALVGPTRKPGNVSDATHVIS